MRKILVILAAVLAVVSIPGVLSLFGQVVLVAPPPPLSEIFKFHYESIGKFMLSFGAFIGFPIAIILFIYLLKTAKIDNK